MKHISSKLIVLTILLTTFLLSATAYFSFTVLKDESESYTYQAQLFQTEVLSEKLQGEVKRIRDVASELLLIRSSPRDLKGRTHEIFVKASGVNPDIKGLGIFLPASGELFEDPAESIAAMVVGGRTLDRPTLMRAAPGGDEFVLGLPAENAVIAIRVDWKPLFESCYGLDLAFVSPEGAPFHYCNQDSRSMFDPASDVMKEVMAMKIDSGTIERSLGNVDSLWAYTQVGQLGRIVSSVPASTAHRPAYSLAGRMVTLVLMAIGAAIVASIFLARRITHPIEQVTAATQRIADGDFDAKIETKTQDETKTLAQSVEAMAAKIKRLLVAEVEKAKLDAQLELAGVVQRTLIPPAHLQFSKLRLDSYYRPADQCGGDWWGYVRAGSKLAVLIGDVSGHGYASALLGAATRGFLSMLQDQIDKAGSLNLAGAEILESLNHVVFDATKGELNMTAMCVVMNLEDGTYEIACAGHTPAYVLAGAGGVTSLSMRGPRLGEADRLADKVESKVGTLASGDRLILYTDGLQDLGPPDQPLGRKGFRDFLVQRSTARSNELVKGVEEVLFPLNAGRSLEDDLTFVVLEREA